MKIDLEILPPDWCYAEVSLGDKPKRIEMIHIPTQTRYVHSSLLTIAFKCFLLFFALPPYFLVYTGLHLTRLIVAPVVNRSPSLLFKQVWKIVRAPFYWMALQCTALYGVFKPLDGRVLFAELERSLHGKERRQDERRQKTLFWEAISVEENKVCFFAGFCMQPYSTPSSAIHLISR